MASKQKLDRRDYLMTAKFYIFIIMHSCTFIIFMLVFSILFANAQQLVDQSGNPSLNGIQLSQNAQSFRAGNCDNPCILKQFNAPTTAPTELAWDGKNLWLCGYSAMSIYKISPLNGAVLKTIPTTVFRPGGLTFDGTHLWVADTDNKLIHRIDTANGNIVATFPTPAASNATYPNGLAWDGFNVYHNDPKGTNGNSSNVDSTFYINDSGTFLKGWLAYGDYPSGLAWDGLHLWSSDNIADVFHEIDISTFFSLRTICVPQGTYPNGLTFDGTYLWYAENQYDKIYQIDPNNFIPVADFSASDTVICPGDTVFFAITGTGATVISWSFPGGIVDTSNKQAPYVIYSNIGFYSVSLNISNCAGGDSILKTNYIEVGSGIQVNFITQNTNCIGTLGSINLTATGGIPPYTFLWSNSATTEDLFNLQPGNYQVTVNDVANCAYIGSVVVSGPTPTGPPDTCRWMGLINANWFEPCNWDKIAVPDTGCVVLVPGGTTFQPVIAMDTGWCREMVIYRYNGGHLYINENSGGKLLMKP